ncbi:hypothetical protein OG786_24080 [Streptomyces sp. NBC_00101]|uniref:hypothetical protein n=1 Tax=Streptomyces sp. NBC_00101 TaxID=2975651 RepID=UPI00324A4F8C
MTPSEVSARRALASLRELACRYRADEVRPEDLPMRAAEALAAGLDTPALCELAGLPRNTDTRDIRDVFEQALRESGVELPALALARRHGLRRLAARLLDGSVTLAGLATDDGWDTEAGTAEERSFVALIPPCACCLEYTVGLDPAAWAAEVRVAALALVASPPDRTDC